MSRRYDELRKLAAEHFKAGGKVKDLARQSGVPRTTVIEWMDKWQRGGHGAAAVGHPFKLEPFKSAEILTKIFAQRSLLDRAAVGKLIGDISTYRMERLGIYRYLKRWNIMPARIEIERIAKAIEHELDTPAGKRRITSVWVDGHPWIVPVGLDGQLNGKPDRILWRLMTRRGMERFMFTEDDSDESVVHLANLLNEKTRWRVHTDVESLAMALKNSEAPPNINRSQKERPMV